MSNQNRCVRCLLPASLPSVHLDDDGVCNQCKSWDQVVANWAKNKEKRHLELEGTVAWAKAQKRPYDCLVPLSGGKDSTYALYLFSQVYGLKCLCVTFDNGFLSPHARRNIENAIRATGAHHRFHQVDRALLYNLYRLHLSKSGQFCSVCMRGIGQSVNLAIREFKVPLVVSGTGDRINFLSDGQMPELVEFGDAGYFCRVVKGTDLEKASRTLLQDQHSHRLTAALDRAANGIAAALPSGLPRRAWWALHARGRSVLKQSGIEKPPLPFRWVRLYDQVDVSFEDMIRTLRNEMNWSQPEGGRFEHMDCLVEDLKVYIQTRKFPGLSRSTIEHSGLIRLGRLGAEEASRIQHDEAVQDEKPPVLDSFLAEVGMSRAEFEDAVRDWRKIETFRKPKVKAN